MEASNGSVTTAEFGRPVAPVLRDRARPCRNIAADRIRVLVCEEDGLVRYGVRHLLDATDDLAVCHTVGSPADLDDLPGAPDVVVHGLVFGRVEGPPVVRRLRERFPRSSLVVLSRLAPPIYAYLCLAAGARGYLLKTAEPDELVAAVRRVAQGEEYVQPALGAALARWRHFPRRQRPETLVLLTAREEQVLELLSEGYTNAETATVLGVALRTVEAHRAHIFEKLGFSNRADLIRFATERSRA